MPPKRGSSRGRATTTRGRAASSSHQPPDESDEITVLDPEFRVTDADMTSVLEPFSMETGPRSQIPTGASARGSASRGPARFKPKAVRRTAEEREAMAQAELKRQSDRVAEETRLQRASGRFRGRGRGRGRGMMGRGGLTRGVQPDGPFSQVGFAAAGSGPRGSAGYGGGGAFGTSGRGLNSDSGPSFMYGQTQLDDNRINADSFNAHTQQDGATHDFYQGASTSTSRSRQLLPMGILRQEHKESEPQVATRAELEAQEQNMTVESAAGAAVANQSSSSSDAMTVDDEVSADAQQLPMFSMKGEERATQEDDTMEELAKESTQKASQPIDLEEQFKRAGLQYMLDTLVINDDSSANTAEDGAEGQEVEDKLYGGVYLFHFPPVMPPLYRESKEPIEIVKDVKDEPVEEDMVMMDALPSTSGDAKGKSTVDLTDDTQEVKEEEDKEGNAPGDESQPWFDIGEGGYLGDLVVRKSGRTTLSWGGFEFQVAPGIAKSFYQEVVLVQEDETKRRPDDVDGYDGKAYSFGPLCGQFNCVPIWSPEKPWVVDTSKWDNEDAEQGNGLAADSRSTEK